MKYKYISKHNYLNQHEHSCCGYSVRLPEITNGLVTAYDVENEFFARSHYKTWKACLAAAIDWRDTYLKKHKAMHVLNKGIHHKRDKPHTKHSSSSIGVIGISIVTRYGVRETTYAYVASWQTGKFKQKNRQFSWNVYGKGGAFISACRMRFKHAGIIIITDPMLIPCYPDVPYEVIT